MKTAITALLLLGIPSASIPAAAKPNIVLILADDLGYGDVGIYGSEIIETPHIDSLARSGTRFTSGYVAAAVCSPSRAALMSGRYPQRFGYEFNPAGPNYALPLDQLTLGESLKAEGYATGIVGKWQLGTAEDRRPLRRGFDEFFGMMSGTVYIDPNTPGVESWSPEPLGPRRRPVIRGDEVVEEKEYLTDALNREALSFIDRHHEEPFFLYLAHYAPHAPLQATKKYLDRYRHVEDQKKRIFAAMVSGVDDSVGAVMAKLREHEIEDDTLVVFLSDNGCALYVLGGCTNGPLNGGKRYFWEGGIRVPMIANWPGKIPEGLVYEQAVISMDLNATILAAAGIDPTPLDLDGVDLRPFLSRPDGPAPHQRLFWRAGPNYAVRDGDWKLWAVNKTSEETLASTPSTGMIIPDWEAPKGSPLGQLMLLSDLSKDLGEKKSVSAGHPEVLERLQRHWREWNKQNKTPMWWSNRGTARQIEGVPVEIIF